jgi:hypothetical protein
MRRALLSVACLALLASTATAQTEPGSVQLTKQLVSAMAARQLEAIAAPDPEEPGRFIAALAYPEVQMLVVSTRHRAADYINLQLSKKAFREVYVLLQDGTTSGRVVVHDMGCDGIIGGSENVDVFYDAKDTTRFDGKWEAQGLTEAAYLAKVKTADEKYSRLLSVLLEAVKKVPVPTRP